MTSSPSWRPGKRTDTNIQVAKLMHSIHTEINKEIETHRGRDMRTRKREIQEERLNPLEDEDTDPKHLE